ncbi:N-acetylmuramidase domain-containing protein [Chryseobacterium sp. T16E-39]|uniref:N-acetylmuramidase domain-containing protein n=1 Tax=Chryseobacterium sp. T16E-39 TaxID=2015076 RepID=UPI003977DB93
MQDFVNKMYRSKTDHLYSFVRYIKALGLTSHLRNKNRAVFVKATMFPDIK